jgi:transcriptional regulator with XRE-family HTH domain
MLRKQRNPFLLEIGAKIKAARKKKGLYTRELAELSGLCYPAVSDIENGKVSFQILNLISIAKALEVDVKDFL